MHLRLALFVVMLNERPGFVLYQIGCHSFASELDEDIGG
jgi:hypothetical protein